MKPLVWLVLALTVFQSVYAQNTAYSAEDLAVVEALIVGLYTDDFNRGMITLNISGIISYARDGRAIYAPLTKGQEVTLGFLWGHKNVKGGEGILEIGDLVEASIGYHFNFTSHSGHLYGYELICWDNEVKQDGSCIPICADNEHVANNKCIPLSCDGNQIAINHICTTIECPPTQYAKDHKCVDLLCSDEEYANLSCRPLDCAPNQAASNHSCVALSCGLFREPSNHKCALTGKSLILIFIAITVLAVASESLMKAEILKRAKSKRILPLLCVLAVLLLLVTPLSRMLANKPVLVGEPAYEQLLKIDQLNSGYSLDITALPSYSFSVLAMVGARFFWEIAAIEITQLIAACVAVLLFFDLLRKMFGIDIAVYSTLILIVSPGFIYLFSFALTEAIFCCVLLFALYILNKNSRLLVALPLLLFLVFYSISGFVLSCLILIIRIIRKSENRKSTTVIMLLILLLGTPHYFKEIFIFGKINTITLPVTDFGALIGFGIFNILLSVIGMVHGWAKKQDYLILYLALAIGFFAALFDPLAYIYLNIVLAFFSALGLLFIINHKWKLLLVRHLTILLIVCGLLFSLISYYTRLTAVDPSRESVEALQWLSHQEKGVVLTLPQYGPFVRYFSAMEPYAEQDPQDLNTASDIFYSRDLKLTQSLLEAGNVSYIFIDTAMRRGGVWQQEREGLLFLFRNNETFKNLYNAQGTEIWAYIRG
ncbi:MAG: hypothetical protein ABIG95_05980 [Candidatus Woesearchaeota archaeon]